MPEEKIQGAVGTGRGARGGARGHRMGCAGRPWPVQFWTMREQILHMNELYKKGPGLSCPMDPPACPGADCSKNGTQCVEISKQVTLSPSATVGTVTTSCVGTPSVSCETGTDGATCTVTLTQRVCVTIPVDYSVTLTDDGATIACGGESCTCGR